MQTIRQQEPSLYQQRSSLLGRWLMAAFIGALLLGVPCGAAEPAASWAEQYVIDQPWQWNEERPVVALALAGGGARALTNLGVVLALAEAGVPIDMLVGTSMGALVAVLYGSGMHPDQIMELLLDVDVASLFHLNAPFTRSVMSGERFNYALEAVVPVKHLEEFPIPTALLSYDLRGGVRYVQTHGPVSEAVTGPYAMLASFPGASRDGRYLVDAGTHEATPARAARLLGADIVIGTTAFNQLAYTEYDSPLRAWGRMLNLIRYNLSQPLAATYSDILVQLDVGRYSLTDFHLADFFVEYGYRETQAQMEAILTLLSERGVPLQHTERQRDPSVDETIAQLRRDRLPFQQPVLQPVLRLGSGNSHLHPWYVQDRGFWSQVGMRVEQGYWDMHILLNDGYHGFDIGARRKQLTTQWDGTLVMGVRGGEPWLAAGAELRSEQSRVQTGWGWSPAHGVSPFLRAGTAVPGFTGEFLALWSDQGLRGFAGVEVDAWAGDVRVGGYAVANVGQWSYGPKRYRGTAPAQPPPWQYGAEVGWRWNTVQTQELLNVVRFAGVELFAFADGMAGRGDAWSLGLGTQLELNLLGLKPAQLSAWTAYDLQAKRPTVGWTVSLSF